MRAVVVGLLMLFAYNLQGQTCAICPGEIAVLTLGCDGGVAPCTYGWNHTTSNSPIEQVSPTTATTYIGTVTDANGCSVNLSQTVTIDPASISLMQNSSVSESCNIGRIRVEGADVNCDVCCNGVNIIWDVEIRNSLGVLIESQLIGSNCGGVTQYDIFPCQSGVLVYPPGSYTVTWTFNDALTNQGFCDITGLSTHSTTIFITQNFIDNCTDCAVACEEEVDVNLTSTLANQSCGPDTWDFNMIIAGNIDCPECCDATQVTITPFYIIAGVKTNTSSFQLSCGASLPGLNNSIKIPLDNLDNGDFVQVGYDYSVNGDCPVMPTSAVFHSDTYSCDCDSEMGDLTNVPTELLFNCSGLGGLLAVELPVFACDDCCPDISLVYTTTLVNTTTNQSWLTSSRPRINCEEPNVYLDLNLCDITGGNPLPGSYVVEFDYQFALFGDGCDPAGQNFTSDPLNIMQADIDNCCGVCEVSLDMAIASAVFQCGATSDKGEILANFTGSLSCSNGCCTGVQAEIVFFDNIILSNQTATLNGCGDSFNVIETLDIACLPQLYTVEAKVLSITNPNNCALDFAVNDVVTTNIDVTPAMLNTCNDCCFCEDLTVTYTYNQIGNVGAFTVSSSKPIIVYGSAPQAQPSTYFFNNATSPSTSTTFTFDIVNDLGISPTSLFTTISLHIVENIDQCGYGDSYSIDYIIGTTPSIQTYSPDTQVCSNTGS